MKKSLAIRIWAYLAAGLAVGLLMMLSYFTGLTVVWHSIGAPAEPLARVEGIDNGFLYIRSSLDHQFAYLLDPDFAEQPVYAWEPVSARLITDEGRAPDPKWMSFPLLVKAEQIYETEFTYNSEGTAYLRLASEPDGTIWMWKVTRPWGETLCYPFYAAVGVITGLLAWLVVGLVKRAAGAWGSRQAAG